jgi:hypothetical protein
VTDRTESKPSIGELVALLSEKISELVRQEIELAKAELADRAKNAGTGIGLFAGAAFFGIFSFGTLVAAAVLGLANAVPAWLAALIVSLALLAIAGVLVLVGKKQLDKNDSSKPRLAQASVKADVAAVKEGLRP